MGAPIFKYGVAIESCKSAAVRDKKMNLNNELFNQPAGKLFFYFIIIITFISSGSLFIFFYNKTLFLDLSVSKLFLLSSIMVVPFFIVSLSGKSAFLNIEKNYKNSPDPGLVIIGDAAFDVFFIFYSILLINWFFNFNFEIKETIKIMIVIQVVLFFVSVINNIYRNKKS